MKLTLEKCIISHHLPQSLGDPNVFPIGTAEVRQTFREIQHKEEAASSCDGVGTPHSPTHTHTHNLGL